MTALGSGHNVGSDAHPSAGRVEQLGSAPSVGRGGQQGGARVEIYDTLWKAAPDVFVVSAAAERIIDAAADEMSALRLISHHPNLTFVTHTRRAEAKAGPALVISDVAEWDGGERHTAVVVSIVVDDDSTPSGGRRATVRTHLEDDHTRVGGTALEFEEHHDLLRAALIDAIRRADPGALHVEAPSPSPERVGPPVAGIRVEPSPWTGPGALSFEEPETRPGDYVVLRAEMDCIVAMSACPQDMVPINGADCVPTEAHFEVI